MASAPTFPLGGRDAEGHLHLHPLCGKPVTIAGRTTACGLLAGHIPNAITVHVPTGCPTDDGRPWGRPVRMPSATEGSP